MSGKHILSNIADFCPRQTAPCIQHHSSHLDLTVWCNQLYLIYTKHISKKRMATMLSILSKSKSVRGRSCFLLRSPSTPVHPSFSNNLVRILFVSTLSQQPCKKRTILKGKSRKSKNQKILRKSRESGKSEKIKGQKWKILNIRKSRFHGPRCLGGWLGVEKANITKELLQFPETLENLNI